MQSSNDSLKTIAKGSFIVFFGVMLSKIFSYIYRIIVSRLGPEDYGILSIALAIFGILGGLTMLGTEVGIVKFISNYNQKKENIKGVIYDSFRFVLPLSIILAILLFIFSDYIAIHFFNSKKLGLLLKILAFFIPINAIRKIFLNSLIGFKLVKYETLAKAITENLSKLIITALLILFGYGLLGALIGYVLGVFISLLIAYYLLRYKVFNLMDNNIKSVYSTKEFYSYSLPLLFSIIVFVVILWTDTLLLGYFKGASDTGIYNAAMPTAQLLLIFPNALMAIFLPVISGINDVKNKEFITIFRAVTKWVLLMNIIPMALFIIYSKQILNIIFSSVYAQGSSILIILSFGFFVSCLAMSSNHVLLAFNKTKTVFFNNMMAAIINIALNLALIPRYGITGAAVSTAVSFIIMAFLMFIASYRLTKTFPLKLNMLKIILSISVPLLITNYIVQKYNIYTIKSIILTALILLVFYIFFLILTRTLEKEDYLVLNMIYKRIGIKINFFEDLFGNIE